MTGSSFFPECKNTIIIIRLITVNWTSNNNLAAIMNFQICKDICYFHCFTLFPQSQPLLAV